MKRQIPKRQKIIWLNNTFYFITSSTYLHYPYFKEDNQKQIVLNQIKTICNKLNVPIQAYCICMNHFHLKLYLKDGKIMTKVKNILHSGISREYKKIYRVKYKKFWQSTKTQFIKDEEMSWKITGYIIGNLLKHREVDKLNDLYNNPYSSFRNTAGILGFESAKNLIYSVIDTCEDKNGDLDFIELKNNKTAAISTM